MIPRPEYPYAQVRAGHGPHYPMEVYNGLVVPKPNRQAPSSDYDETPRLFRRYVNASGVQDVQIRNGLRNRIGTGYRFSYGNAGYLNVIQPRSPGQMRGNYGGFAPRGTSPYNYADIQQNGPGSQPAHPGGPGMIAANVYANPMTG